MTVWKLQSGSDRRIRGGHPWIFSNELQGSPKGHQPGQPVTLLDAKGSFLAHGYGNPHSLIAFRAVSFQSADEECLSLESLVEKVKSAWGHRSLLGYRRSFRVIFGEADFLPGLVFDRYLLESNKQVFVFQILTAGMELALRDLEKFARRIAEETFESGLSQVPWEETAVVRRCDVQIRKLEGLEVLEPEVIRNLEAVDLRRAKALVDPISESEGDEGVPMSCDLIEGQKTGFFLDQSWNIQLVGTLLGRNPHLPESVRILDLCTYVGQWSTKLAQHLTKRGIKVEAELVDVSASALAFAKENVERQGARVLSRQLDVMEELGQLPEKHYDLVIADPPAFMKAKKDLPTAKHAYLKLNSNSFRLVKPGGLLVSCSCSGLFPEVEFQDVLRKANQRVGGRARAVIRGGPAPDHPVLMAFPEGNYLKMIAHQIAF